MTYRSRRSLWALVGLLLCTLLAGCSLGGATKPAGATKAEATATPSPTPAPKPTTLYFAVAQTVYAFDLQTSAKRWSFDIGVQSQYGAQPIGALAATPDTLVFLDPENETIYALSAVDGSLKWKSDSAQATDELVMAPGVVIASSGNVQAENSTSAFDLATGKVLWTQPIGGTGWAVGDGIVYKERILPNGDAAPITDGTLQALNPATGAVIWQVTGHAFGGLNLIGSTLYSLADDALHAFDAKTGVEIWKYTLNSASPSFWLTDQGAELYFGDQTTMYALDGTTHTIQWQVPLNGYCTDITKGVIACNASTSQSGSDHYLSGVDTTSGSVHWQATDLGSKLPWGATADNGLFLVSGVQGETLGAIDAQNGTVRWTLNVSGADNGVLALDGVVYVAVYQYGEPDKLYAVSETDGSTLWSFDAGATSNSQLAVG